MNKSLGNLLHCLVGDHIRSWDTGIWAGINKEGRIESGVVGSEVAGSE